MKEGCLPGCCRGSAADCLPRVRRPPWPQVHLARARRLQGGMDALQVAGGRVGTPRWPAPAVMAPWHQPAGQLAQAGWLVGWHPENPTPTHFPPSTYPPSCTRASPFTIFSAVDHHQPPSPSTILSPADHHHFPTPSHPQALSPALLPGPAALPMLRQCVARSPACRACFSQTLANHSSTAGTPSVYRYTLCTAPSSLIPLLM